MRRIKQFIQQSCCRRNNSRRLRGTRISITRIKFAQRIDKRLEVGHNICGIGTFQRCKGIIDINDQLHNGRIGRCRGRKECFGVGQFGDNICPFIGQTGRVIGCVKRGQHGIGLGRQIIHIAKICRRFYRRQRGEKCFKCGQGGF